MIPSIGQSPCFWVSAAPRVTRGNGSLDPARALALSDCCADARRAAWIFGRDLARHDAKCNCSIPARARGGRFSGLEGARLWVEDQPRLAAGWRGHHHVERPPPGHVGNRPVCRVRQLGPPHPATLRVKETVTIGRLRLRHPDRLDTLDKNRRRDLRHPHITSGARLRPRRLLGRGVALDQETCRDHDHVCVVQAHGRRQHRRRHAQAAKPAGSPQEPIQQEKEHELRGERRRNVGGDPERLARAPSPTQTDLPPYELTQEPHGMRTDERSEIHRERENERADYALGTAHDNDDTGTPRRDLCERPPLDTGPSLGEC